MAQGVERSLLPYKFTSNTHAIAHCPFLMMVRWVTKIAQTQGLLYGGVGEAKNDVYGFLHRYRVRERTGANKIVSPPKVRGIWKIKRKLANFPLLFSI